MATEVLILLVVLALMVYLFIINGNEKKKLLRLLSKMDRCCGKLGKFVTEPNEWVIVRAIACDIMDLIKEVKEMKEVFRRTK